MNSGVPPSQVGANYARANTTMAKYKFLNSVKTGLIGEHSKTNYEQLARRPSRI